MMRIRQETSVSLENRAVLAQERVVLVVLHCPTSSKKTSTTVWKRPTLTRKPSESGRKPFTKNAPRANSPKHIFTNFSNRYTGNLSGWICDIHWTQTYQHKCNSVFTDSQNLAKSSCVFAGLPDWWFRNVLQPHIPGIWWWWIKYLGL